MTANKIIITAFVTDIDRLISILAMNGYSVEEQNNGHFRIERIVSIENAVSIVR
jgi:hypothetical protein